MLMMTWDRQIDPKTMAPNPNTCKFLGIWFLLISMLLSSQIAAFPPQHNATSIILRRELGIGSDIIRLVPFIFRLFNVYDTALTIAMILEWTIEEVESFHNHCQCSEHCAMDLQNFLTQLDQFKHKKKKGILKIIEILGGIAISTFESLVKKNCGCTGCCSNTTYSQCKGCCERSLLSPVPSPSPSPSPSPLLLPPAPSPSPLPLIPSSMITSPSPPPLASASPRSSYCSYLLFLVAVLTVRYVFKIYDWKLP